MASRVDDLYASDFYSWARKQSLILRDASQQRLNAPAGLDWDHVAETLEEIVMSLEGELYHRYIVVVLHLLKWRHQPQMRSGSWRTSINEQRRQLARLCSKNPGIRPRRAAEFADAYVSARNKAAAETGLAIEVFPATCPFSLEQAEDPDFWPEG